MDCCQGFEERIFDYVDDLIPAHKRKELEDHLNSCAGCSVTLKRSKSLRHQLRHLPTLRTSEDFQTVLRTRIRLERSIGRRSLLNRPIRIPMYAAASVGLAVVAVFMLGIFGDQRQPIQSNSSNLVAPFSNRGLQTESAARAVPSTVNFPMDYVNVSGRATSINSSELNRYSSTRTDSSRDGKAREVTFEF